MSYDTKTLARHLSQFALGCAFIVSGCDRAPSNIARVRSLTDDSPIKVAIADRDVTGRIVAVFAKPAQPIITGSFEYCLGQPTTCDSDKSLRKKLIIARPNLGNTSTTRSFHKIEDTLDLQDGALLNFYALDARSEKSIQTRIRVSSARQQEITPNQNIDRFQFDVQQLQKTNPRITGIEFDYGYGQQSFSSTAPNIRFRITNEELLNLGQNLGIVAAGSILGDSSTFVTSNTAVSAGPNGVVTIVGENFKPDSLYKIRLHFFDRTEKSQQNRLKYLGASSRTYQFVTDSDLSSVAKARARITMRALAEANDWEQGRYDTQKGYTNDPGYGWCHMFYDWVIKPYLKTQQGTTHTHYNQTYWDRFNAAISAAELINLKDSESLHGNYFHVGSHVGMILAFDSDRNEFVTLEGNFNNRVMILRRSPDELSWIGHIRSEMIKP